MAHLDIYNRKWIDVIFAGRNKDYGAYQLRKESGAIQNKALIIGGLIYITVIVLPHNLWRRPNLKQNDLTEKITEVTLSQIKKPDKAIPISATPPETQKSKSPRVKFPPLVVVPATEVTEAPPTVNEFAVADPGQKTEAGNNLMPIIIDEPIGNADKQENLTETEATLGFESLDVIPEFKGGMEKFYQYIGKTYRYPAMAQEKGVSGKVYLSFVIEKDGSLTDIKVLRDLGMGTGEEAIRVLQNSPKWSPGIQNGRPVRVSYTLPLSLNLEVQ